MKSWHFFCRCYYIELALTLRGKINPPLLMTSLHKNWTGIRLSVFVSKKKEFCGKMLLNLINPGSLHRQTLHACAPKASVVTWNPLCRLKPVNRHMTDTVRYQTDHPAIYRHCWWMVRTVKYDGYGWWLMDDYGEGGCRVMWKMMKPYQTRNPTSSLVSIDRERTASESLVKRWAASWSTPEIIMLN